MTVGGSRDFEMCMCGDMQIEMGQTGSVPGAERWLKRTQPGPLDHGRAGPASKTCARVAGFSIRFLGRLLMRKLRGGGGCGDGLRRGAARPLGAREENLPSPAAAAPRGIDSTAPGPLLHRSLEGARFLVARQTSDAAGDATLGGGGEADGEWAAARVGNGCAVAKRGVDARGHHDAPEVKARAPGR